MLKVTFYVIVVALIASSGGLLFGYDLVSKLTGCHIWQCRAQAFCILAAMSIKVHPGPSHASRHRLQGVTGGVTAMPDFLEMFFPDVLAAQQNKSTDPYCSFDSQKLQAFTSTLFLSGGLCMLAGSEPLCVCLHRQRPRRCLHTML